MIEPEKVMLRLPVKREKKPSLIFLKPFFSLFHAAVMDFLPFIACHAGVKKNEGSCFFFWHMKKGKEGMRQLWLRATFSANRAEKVHRLCS